MRGNIGSIKIRPKRIKWSDAALKEESPIYAIQMRRGEGYFRNVQGIPPTGDFFMIAARFRQLELDFAGKTIPTSTEFRLVRYEPIEVDRISVQGRRKTP